MTRRTLRVVVFTIAVCVLALGSALGAAALTSGGATAAAMTPLRVVAGDQRPLAGARGAPQEQATSSANCACQSRTRPAPPPPPPPPTPIVIGSLIYAGSPQPAGGAPGSGGKVILVSTSQQWIFAYQNGTLMLAAPVTTGMPQLPTPTGVYQVSWKVQNTEFISPWPQGSPYYYTPEHVNYALLFRAGGFFLHDAPWRQCFGPGTNVPHTCPNGTQETGSHGCVNMPTPVGAWLFAWAPYFTTIIIR